MYRKKWLLAIGIIAALGLTGCQKSPDSSIVVNKDFENLIEEAQDGEGTGIGDMKKYDTYQTTLEDTSLGVRVTVDAKVDIPETDQMSVIRVEQKSVGQELLDKVRKALGKEDLYDGGITLSVRTRSDVEAEIGAIQSELKELEQTEPGENIAALRQQYQQMIDEFQEEYENAPSEIVWEGNESDGLLHSVSELYGRDDSNEFYSWEYSLNPDGEVYYGVSDGKNGSYCSLFVQNNENLGNCIRYRRSNVGYEFTAIAIVGSSNLSNPYASQIWSAEEEMPADLLEVTTGSTGELLSYDEEPITMTQEEAQKLAEEFLAEIGLDSYQYYEGGLYCEIPDIRPSYDLGYTTRYILRYARNIDGAFVTFDATSKHAEGWEGDDYVKKDWPVECIEFRVDNDGIAGFDYNAPLEEIETVVDDSGIKTFDEVKDIFEKMVVVTNAREDSQISVQVDRVVLGYARISEADSYDTGLLVPVWDFLGKTEEEIPGGSVSSYGSVLTVNAIDGSIIDRSLGY